MQVFYLGFRESEQEGTKNLEGKPHLPLPTNAEIQTFFREGITDTKTHSLMMVLKKLADVKSEFSWPLRMTHMGG